MSLVSASFTKKRKPGAIWRLKVNGRWCWGWKKWVILSLWKQVLALIYFYPKAGFKQWFFLIITENLYSKFLYLLQLMNWSVPQACQNSWAKLKTWPKKTEKEVGVSEQQFIHKIFTTVKESARSTREYDPSAKPKPRKMLDVEGKTWRPKG